MNALRGALSLTALAVLWSTGRSALVVPLWVSLTLVASTTGPLLTELGGRRYASGWYAGRASFAFASCVLLAVLLAEFVKLQGALAHTLARLRRQTEVCRPRCTGGRPWRP